MNKEEEEETKQIIKETNKQTNRGRKRLVTSGPIQRRAAAACWSRSITSVPFPFMCLRLNEVGVVGFGFQKEPF